MGNFSRNTFSPQTGYVSVRLQQGVPLVDAEWNELSDVTRDETYRSVDLTSAKGLESNAFNFLSGAPNNSTVAGGTSIVNGKEIAWGPSPRGRYRDRLLDAEGSIRLTTDWQHNLVVEGLRQIVAALVMGDPQGTAIAYWALGAGDEGWDGGTVPPPATIETRTELFNETGRIAVPTSQIRFVNPPIDNEIELSGEFIIADIIGGEPEGRLREFGLFAGGTATAGSGIMINHRIHPRIDMQAGFILQRTLRLTF